jgi:transglutaminase-like putative cysteine protease
MSTPMTGGMFSQRTFGRDRSRRAGAGGRHRRGVVAATATLLAAAPLMSVFDQWTWLFHCAFAVAAVAGAAIGARALRMPVVVQVLAMLGALTVALTWQFRSGDELLGILPGAGTLDHVGALLAEVPAAVSEQAAPVPDNDGLLLLTTAGVGLVAVLVDLLAAGLRRPALAGLPMLAVYSVPVAVLRDSVPAFAFAVGVTGYLWLLGADNLDRVRRFGRRFTGSGRDVEPWEPSPLAAAGRRLAVVGLLVAIALPLAVPGMTSGLVERVRSGVNGSGSGSGGTPSSVNLFAYLDGELNRDVTVDLLRVTTDDRSPFYLRVGIADRVTAQGFDHRPPQGGPVSELPGPAFRNGVTLNRHQAQVEVLGFDMDRLPTYPELTEISGMGAGWRYDSAQQVVFSGGGSRSGGLTYSFGYFRPEFDPDALRQAAPLPAGNQIQREFTQVLAEPRVSDLVDEVTAGATTPYDQVRTIHRYFSAANGFRYSLETGPATSGSAIVDFLFENQVGFCVQYATAMAWMVREAGMPARVAIGFTRGSRTDASYVMTNRNLHAWTEVYFDGFGWVPFDPTPSAAITGAVDSSWAPDPESPEGPDGNNPDDGTGGTPLPPGEGPQGPNAITPDLGPGGLPPGQEQSNWRWWALGVVVFLVGSLVAPALHRGRLRRRRLAVATATTPTVDPAPGVVVGAAGAAAQARAHAVWDELLDTMVDFQVPLDPAETPRATAERLITQCRLDVSGSGAGEELGDRAGAPAPGDVTDGVRLLGRAEERARYAPSPLHPTGLEPALRAARQALAARSTPGARWRARLLPPSTLLRWRGAAIDTIARVAWAFNRIGEELARLSPRRWLASR